MATFRLEYSKEGETREFPFEKDAVTIGRDQSADFVLDHPTVSRQHAVIRREAPGQLKLVVLSRGGLTAVDGEQIDSEIELHDGSKINFGKLVFTFRSQEAPRKPASHGSQAGAGSPSGGFGAQSGPSGGGAGQSGQFGQQSGQSGGGAGTSGQFGHQGGQSGGTSGEFGPPGGQAGDSSGGFGPPGGDSNGGGTNGGGLQGGGFGPPQQQTGGQQSGGQQAGGQQSGQSEGDMFAQSARGFQAGATGAQDAIGADSSKPTDESQTAKEEAGIVSWDEIASSEEAKTEEEKEEEAREAESPFERMQRAAESDDEESRPLLLIVGAIGIVAMLGYIFFGGGGGGGGDKNEKLVEGDKQLKVEVDCIGAADCKKQAIAAYKIGSEDLKKAGVTPSNRFEGYKALLKAEKFLERAGVDKPPKEMDDLQDKKKRARDMLDKTFRNYRVAFHQAKSTKNYKKMAQSLSTIKSYFPDKDAYEHRWAKAQERRMKQRGTYPK